MLVLAFISGVALVACAQDQSDTTETLPQLQFPTLQAPSTGGASNSIPASTATPTASPSALPPPAESSVNSIDVRRYRLGVGDQLVVDIYGAYRAHAVSAIAPDGTLFINDVGKVRIFQLTLAQATRRVQEAVYRYFRNCDVHVQLLSVRRFNVYVLGDVRYPGMLEVKSTTTAYQAILTDGVNPTGSQRAITLTNTRHARSGAIQLDLVKWKYGLAAANPVLIPGDVITVPTQGPVVNVIGNVRRPGNYEILPTENVDDLLALAGGFTSTADREHVELSHLKQDGGRKGLLLDLSTPTSMAGREHLRSGDQLQVLDRTIGKDTITVIGELQGTNVFPETVNQLTGQKETQRSAIYPIHEGEGVREVALALGGPTVKADFEHVQIQRRLPDGQIKVITVNLNALLSGSSRVPDVALQNGDVLNVPAKEDSVYVIGDVVKPGPVPYNPNFGLRQYLTVAGGVTNTAATQHGRIVRPTHAGQTQGLTIKNVDVRKVLEGKIADNYRFQPGDIILVPHFHPFYADILQAISPFVFITPYVTK